MIKGFDTCTVLTAKTAAKMKDYGYEFAIRYCVPESYTKALTRKEAEEFFSLYQRLNNSTHMWGNYGWTPKELPESSRPSDIPAANRLPDAP